MAAGGGIFTTENKVLPGAYINFISKARAIGNIGERGVLAMPWYGDFGKVGEIIEIDAESFQTDCVKILGHSYSENCMLPLREAFKGAKTVKLFRMGGGQKASGTGGNLTVTALFEGERGNDIKVVISNDPDGSGFIVETYLDGYLRNSQNVGDAGELEDNDFVSFSGSGALSQNAGIVLTGGTNGVSSGEDYSEFLNALESEDFTTVIYPGSDDVTKGLFAQFTKRLREDEGYKVTCVLNGFDADFEGVINLSSKCDSMYGFDEGSLIYWVGGMAAGAEVNESLTNKAYDGELRVLTNFKKSQLKEAVENGKFIFYGDRDSVRVLKDINSFVSFSPEKNRDFSNNQIIRILDAVANDTARIFNEYYLGKCQNNALGRDIFKTELVSYHQKLMAIGAIEAFIPENITVSQGGEKGDVIVNEYIEPIGAMETLYMTCIVG